MKSTALLENTAHTPREGFPTCFAFSQDGMRIYTGGSDSLVRIWSTDLGTMQEPNIVMDAQDAITSLATSKLFWLSGSHDSCVRTYDAQGCTMEGLVTRAVAVPVRDISMDPKGERVAVASDELEVKIIYLDNVTNIQKLHGHRKGVRRVTWHPLGTLLTTCGSDGDVIIWDVSPGKEPQKVETITGMLPVIDAESSEYVYDCSAAWHPSGKYFIIANRSHDLIMISRETWEKTFVFSDDDATGPVTALAFSPNGLYLAAAYKAGVFVWSTTTRKVLFRHTPAAGTVFSLVSHLAFSPTQNLLAWTNAAGTLTRWPEPIPSTLPDPVNAYSSPNIGLPLKKKSNVLFSDEDGNEDSNRNHAPEDIVVDDEYDINDEDWMIDDIGMLDNPEKEEEHVERGFTKEMVSVTKAQPPFQPGSTPMVNRKRYLTYNMIGVIEVTDQDTHHIVNVEFHDRSTHSGSHFQDPSKYDLASLGERGALYSTLSENDQPSQIAYKPHSGWTSSGEWQYSLPQGETAIALAAGGSLPTKSHRNQTSEGDLQGYGNIVVATNRGYLRFFTGSGVQRYLWALGADVVTMVAGREWVFVVHRDGGTSLDGCQNLAYTLVAWETFNIVQEGKLPLPRGCILKWIGISEEGTPAIYDSNGLLSMLDRFRRPSQARWVPILDTNTLARRKGKHESYWPVGLSGTLFMCIILKGREEYPGFPRPLIQELELQMPLMNLDIPQGQMEERFLREELQIGMLRDALGADLTSQEISHREFNLDKELIQLIQLACKGDKLQRALDIAMLFHHMQSYDTAVKVAQFYHLVGLQDKLMALKEKKAETNRLEEEREQRKSWGKQVVSIVEPQIRAGNPLQRRQLDEFTSSPVTVRKSLAPATPILSNVPGSYGLVGALLGSRAKDNSVAPGGSDPRSGSSGVDSSFSSSGDGKRKREDSSVPEVDQPVAASTKRRALSGAEASEGSDFPSNKTTSNPFVRKPQDTKPNPFSRFSGSKVTVASKSNSFFDKVDEANDIATQAKVVSSKSKGKEVKKNSQQTTQTTLFGLPSGPVAGKRGRGRPTKDKGGDSKDSEPTQPLLDSENKMLNPMSSEEVPPEDTMNTQATDLTIIDPSSDGTGKSKELVEDSQGSKAFDGSEPEIEWPPSPSRAAESSTAPQVIEG